MKDNYSTRRAYIDLIQDATRPNTFKIVMIYTAVSARREGLATDLLREVCADADREGVTLMLAVMPDRSGNGPDAVQLWNWYAKHGFVEAPMQSGPARMIRFPMGCALKKPIIQLTVPTQEPQPGDIVTFDTLKGSFKITESPAFPIMRVTDSDGDVSWLDGHNEQDAFDSFGPDISIAFMWGRVE